MNKAEIFLVDNSLKSLGIHCLDMFYVFVYLKLMPSKNKQFRSYKTHAR